MRDGEATGPGPAGRRWWLPGAVAGPVAGSVAGLVTAVWRGYEAGGCGDRPGSFACLGAALMGLVAVTVLGPPALWLLYHLLGVRERVLAVLVAAAVAAGLLTVPELLHQVGLAVGRPGPLPVPVPVATGLLVGVGAAAGGLALRGPRRVARGAVGGGLLVAMVAVVLGLQPATEREETRLDLIEASVPLLVPDGHAVFAVSVGEDGGLAYHAVPVGHEGYGYDGARVEVAPDVSRFGGTCSYRDCTDDGDVRVEVGETGDGYGSQAWRVVDGALVTVTTGTFDAPVDLVGLLRSVRPVTVEEVLDRRYREPS